MCDKYDIKRLNKVYEATNKYTNRQYRRFISYPRQWYENQEPVRNHDLVNTLEGAVCDYLNQPQPRTSTHRPLRAPFVPPLRKSRVQQNMRGEGNRYE